LDTDPGVDDAVAILMALAAPEAELLGLTTVGGNVPLARATRNALALLAAAERSEVPVARGSARPLRGRFRPSVAFHGPGGLSVRLPDPSVGVVGPNAIEFLGERLARRPGEITVAALGPLTNLARLERRSPGTLKLAAHIVVMGGAVDTPGNVTPLAEFNFHSDAVAAREVLSCGVPLTLVDLAACRQVWVDREQAGRLHSPHPLGQLAGRLVQNWFRRDPARQRFEFYDPLAIAVALDPGMVTTRRAAVSVGTSQDAHWGETTVTGATGPISVAAEVDAERFHSALWESFGW
jgi:inosine-uridine nucleoside N-ribohydrolase